MLRWKSDCCVNVWPCTVMVGPGPPRPPAGVGCGGCAAASAGIAAAAAACAISRIVSRIIAPPLRALIVAASRVRRAQPTHAAQPAIVVVRLAVEVLRDLGMRQDQKTLLR